MNSELVCLLNAYLDGELTPTQTEQVEHRLADDPEARSLLAELRLVRDRLGALPRASAPAGLAEQVQMVLERQALLGREDTRAEAAGRHHLRLRRFLAAAAMVVLTGAIGWIIYGVLYAPSPGGSEQAVSPAAPSAGGEILAERQVKPFDLLAGASAAAETEKRTAVAGAKHPDLVFGRHTSPAVEGHTGPVVAAVPAGPGAETILPPVRPAYAAVELVLEPLEADTTGRVARLLRENKVDTWVRSPLPAGGVQYAFLCTEGQLRRLLPSLAAHGRRGLGLRLPSPTPGEAVLLSGVSPVEVFTAVEASRTWRHRPSRTPPQGAPAPPILAQGKSPVVFAPRDESLPDWLDQAIELHRSGQAPQGVAPAPHLDDLRLLGPAGDQTPVPQVSPPGGRSSSPPGSPSRMVAVTLVVQPGHASAAPTPASPGQEADRPEPQDRGTPASGSEGRRDIRIPPHAVSRNLDPTGSEPAPPPEASGNGPIEANPSETPLR